MTDASAEERPARPAPELIPGVPRAVSPLVRRILAPNPGVMTGPGTNTYLVGIDEVAVIDPGPEDDGHLDTILGCGGDRIRWILCTHTHSDHSPLAGALAERTGAEILAFDSRDGLSVDRQLGDGDRLDGTEFRLTALYTPGHASNHLCFLLEGEATLFSGDHVMQGSTVVIAPPDGDMAEYLASLERVRRLRPRVRTMLPGHGDVIDDPAAKLEEYVVHRGAREAAIAGALAAAGRATVEELVEAVYTDVPEALHPIARYSVWAHLRKLAAEGRARGDALDDPWEPLAP
ncbi:MAG: MBL fold metallo-hydrolase [Acidimicrobiia bacterium]|nr:MBL fold metallo-hydrolase [Acidimicrobiia bacterium]